MKRLLFTLTAGLLALVTTSGISSASTTPVGYLAQAKQLGLTSKQASDLQNRADSYLSTLGGQQVAADRIRLSDGADLVLALPTTGKVAAVACTFEHMCAFRYENYQGDLIDMWHCNWYRIPWKGNGSWINNQFNGTVAIFRDDDGIARWQSPAYDSDLSADWNWVHWVQNC
jgi:hypothetical protein